MLPDAQGTNDKPRTRNAEATRAAILDSAEALFSEKGFANTSLEEIGIASGFSRGTPGYFFSSKLGLYHATLERVFLSLRDRIASERAAALEQDGPPEERLRAFVRAMAAGYLATPRTVVRLVEWENLNDARELGELPERTVAIEEALRVLEGLLAECSMEDVDARFVLATIAAVSWFPLAHARGLIASLGIDLSDPRERELYADHVVSVVIGGLRRPNDTFPGISGSS